MKKLITIGSLLWALSVFFGPFIVAFTCYEHPIFISLFGTCFLILLCAGAYKPRDGVISNCFIFALCKWVNNAGYLIIRRSHWGPWPHFIWARSLENADIEHYVPVGDSLKVGSVSKFFFRGNIKTKDEETVEHKPE